MTLLRWLGLALPQLLLLLLLGGRFDLLGGWNHGDTAMGTLLILLVATPVVTGSWLAAEWVVRRRPVPGGAVRTGRVRWAAAMFAESLLLNLWVLSQLRMH